MMTQSPLSETPVRRGMTLPSAMLSVLAAIGMLHSNSQAATINADEVSPGYNGTDATECLQNALNQVANNPSAPDTVIVRDRNAGGVNFWQIRPITISRPVILQINADVVLQAKVNEFKGKSDCLITVTANNVTIKGSSNTTSKLAMRKSDYQDSSKYTASEFRHVLNVRGVDNFTAKDLQLSTSGGDGIIITESSTRSYCSNVLLDRIDSAFNHRQGFSLISAENFTANDCIFRNTSGTIPEAGIDIEPFNDTHRLKNVKFNRCQFNDNRGDNINVGLFFFHNKKDTDITSVSDGDNPNREITIEFNSCTTSGGQSDGIRVGGQSLQNNADRPLSGTIEFRNSTVTGCQEHGLRLGENYRADINPTVNFRRIGVINTAQRSNTLYFPVWFDNNQFSSKSGDINFLSNTNGACYINDNKTRPAVKVDPEADDLARRAGFKDITGSIDVTPNANDPGTATDIFGTTSTNVTLNVY
jgi:hypothetical protein